MQRRDFCKFLAVTTASKALPTFGQTAGANEAAMPSGFGDY